MRLGRLIVWLEKGGSLHTGRAISVVTMKERMVYFVNFVFLFLFDK